MRFTVVFSLLSVFSLVLASPSRVRDYHPDQRATRTEVGRDLGHLTNAQRMARGLPPKAPARRNHGAGLANARRSGPSQTTLVSYNGIIEIVNSASNAVIGYISESSLNGAQYQVASNPTTALIVDFRLPLGATVGNQVRITTENSDSGFSILSLIQGMQDTNTILASGSYEYVIIGGSTGTAPGATPGNVANSYTSSTGISRSSETDVWTIDLSTGIIVPKWINGDSTSPTISCWTQSTGLYCGADQGAYNSRFPSPVTAVTLKFIPSV